MSSRFAESYLSYREKLKSLLVRVDHLAAKSHTKIEGVREMVHDLDEPLKILICGDIGVGRSTFIDTLMGSPVSTYLKAKKWSAVDFSSQIQADDVKFPVKKATHNNFENLLIVEAPPCNSLAEVDQDELEHWVEQADVVFWVFSVDNPWSAGCWGAIEKLSKLDLEKSVVLLNRVDQLPESDVEVMLGHMKDLSRQRLGDFQKVYPISYSEEETVGYADVWEKANQLLGHSYRRVHYLAQVKDKIHRVLDLIESGTDQRASLLDGDKGFLRSLEADIDRQRERETQLYAGPGVDISNSFKNQLDPMLKHLDRSCGLLSTTVDLFGRGMVASRVEKAFTGKVADDFEKRGKADCKKILLDCREHWRGMQAHLDERLGSDAGEFQLESFDALIPEIGLKLRKASKSAVLSMKIRHMIDTLVDPRRAKLKSIMMFILIVLTLAGVCGTLQLPPNGYPALVLAGVSGLGVIYYLLKATFSRKSIFLAVVDRVGDLRSAYREGVHEAYHDMVRELFTGYTPMFEEMRQKIANAKLNLEPLQSEHHSLFLELKAIENEAPTSV